MSIEKSDTSISFELSIEDLFIIITNALEETMNAVVPSENLGQEHYELSQKWVRSLAEEFEEHYEKSDKHSVIKSFYRDKTDPSRTEFLFDISVGKCMSFCTKFSKVPIEYIAEPIWQIESEFEEDTREIAKDFAKLISGIAPFKMMIGPPGKEKGQGFEYYMNQMSKLAGYISDTLYFLILPHPSDWVDEKGIWNNGGKWYLYKWKKNKWEKVPEGKGYWKLKR